MKVALGFKAHSGWAALVVIGGTPRAAEVVERRRVDLVEAEWAKAPYHAAEGMEARKAEGLVKRATEMAQRVAFQEMKAAIERARGAGHAVAGCGVLVPNPMPEWTVEQIRAVHFRMHKAEGVLFPDALVRAAAACGCTPVAVPEKQLAEYLEKALRTPIGELNTRVGELGKRVGAPWGKDQKCAALAAMAALT